MSKDKPPSGNNGKTWWKRLRAALADRPGDVPALVEVLRDSEARNILPPEVLAMLEGALSVSELQVRDIMVPRVQMTVIDHDADLKSIIKTALDSGHSRFPVVGDDQGEVLGILLAKDLLSCFAAGEEGGEFKIKDLMRPAVFVPESKRLNVLLRELRATRHHLAMVVDEYGLAGLVTIEDVMEEIVGEIEDEHDMTEPPFIESHGRDRYTVQALTPIEEFNEYFGTELDNHDYETIGGLVVEAFGHLPERGETIEFAGRRVKVLRADKRRVRVLLFEGAAPERSQAA